MNVHSNNPKSMITLMLVSLVLSLLPHDLCIAQTIGESDRVKNAKNYFDSMAENLDEIEGVYDCSFRPYYSGGNYLFGQRRWGGDEFHTSAHIVKCPEGYNLFLHNNKIKMSSGIGSMEDFLLRSLGDTNLYTLTGKFEEDYKHFGNSGTIRFNISTRASFSQNVLSFKFKGGNGFHNIEVVMSLVKIYPTYRNRTNVTVTKPTSWTGTGFALSNNYVVTNCHVVENARTITLTGINGRFETKYTATIVGTDKNNDLALLKINGNVTITSIPYSVKTITADVGEDVFVLGYPLTTTMGDEIKLTTGVISSKSGFQGDVSQYQISAPIQPGNSGGPLFDSKGNVIGIVSAKHAGAENVGYAIKSSYLRNLVESVASSSVLPQTNRVANQNLSGKVKAVKNYIYYITCTR